MLMAKATLPGNSLAWFVNQQRWIVLLSERATAFTEMMENKVRRKEMMEKIVERKETKM